MYELEIKYNGKPITNQKYVKFEDARHSIERLNYLNMYMLLETCTRFENILDINHKKIGKCNNVITCNVTYYDDDDISMQYEIFRFEVRA